MTLRSLAAMAIMILICVPVHASEASLASAVLACAAQQGEKAQLACYNGLAAQLRGAGATAAQTPAAPPPRNIPPPQQAAPGDFGKESLPSQAYAPRARDQITARVMNVTTNFFRIFTVTLDNGQVWRQVDGDTRKARFKNDKTETVTITRGFLDSYHLVIQGAWGDYTVKRIK